MERRVPTATRPFALALAAATVMLAADLVRRGPRRSVVTTAETELTPESMLDIAAAKIAAMIRPSRIGGIWSRM